MLLVHLEKPTSRTRYVIRHVLERMLGLDVVYAQGLEEFRSASGPRLSYGSLRVEGAVNIPWTGAIDGQPLVEPMVHVEGGRRRMFVVNGEEDVFAGIFFLLSLTDEMRCMERDAHGRVPSSALFTVRKGFADRPWVDERAMELGALLKNSWGDEVRSDVRYHNLVTVDMDNLLRYFGRPISRAVGASLKDLIRGEWSAVAERWTVRSGRVIDPYMRAVELVEENKDNMDRAIFFFLMRGGTTFDHAADHMHPITRGLIQRAAQVGEAGVHPSYHSRDDRHLAEQERKALQHIVGREVASTRQHFLRWSLPGTLRDLDHMPGLHQEHTLGFADRAGFRASTCTPFPWYDLEQERETGVMLHPFAAMDSALIEKQGMGPDEVVRTMSAMSDLVRAVNGQFVSVWHDRYLSGHREFAPWPSVFQRVMEHARP
jgi:hypothetical protein